MSYSDPIPLSEGAKTAPPELPSQEGPVTVEDSAEVTLPAAQVAALCWRFHKKRVQVLLVTSRETRRWVLPKGWPVQGLGPEAAAAREAWEEAGVEGKVCTVAIGSYCYDKILRDKNPLACAVAVYPLRVQRLHSSFPERKQRRRKWFTAEEASHLVAETDLGEFLLRVSEAPECLTPAAPVAKSVAGKTQSAKSGTPAPGSKPGKAAKS